MDAYQQPPPSYARPPPTVDPYHHYYQNPARPPPPPQQQAGPSWQTNQFQYSHSPSSPPPPPSHWGPPPHPPPSEHLPQPNPFGTYTPAPPPPYAAHLQYPLPARPAMPPPVYPPANQEWGNTNWGYNQGQGYQAQTNTEDWAAKAREWAAAKAATENQHPQSQLTPENRPGEHSGFSEQYLQSAGTHYQENSHQDIQQHSASPSSYQQFPHASVAPQDVPYHGGDRRIQGVSTAGFPHQASLSTSSTIHQQEVPSSYSSVPGTEDAAEHKESYKSPPMLMSVGQTGQNEEQYAYGNHAADPNGNHGHHPLHFTPRLTPGPEFHLQSSYASVPNAWAPPVATGVGYLPIPSLHSAPQHDSSITAPSVSGHSAPSFGRFPPPNFQPTIPSAGTSYIRPSLHPTAAFLDDSYGASAVSERAKKASVPNWLREEILKNKAALGKSSLERPEEEAKAIDDEVVHKSVLEADQADNKSFDSSKSIEDEEEEDEDYVEAARTAAINQEIKRILTEVLLKVTDKLFDEIATKVVNEGTTPEDELEGAQNHQAFPKILVPHKTNGSDPRDVDRNLRSQSSGDLLGLANYASDDEDEDGEDEDKEDNKVKSGSLKSSSNNVVQESTIEKIPEGDASENGKLNLEPGGKTSLERDKDCDLTGTSVPETKDDKSGENALAPVSRIMDDKADGDSTDVVKTLKGKAEISVKSANLSIDFQQENKRGSGKHLGKDLVKDTSRADDKLDEDLRKLDGSRHEKEKTDFQNGLKDRTKVQDFKPADMIKEHESRKTFTRADVKEDKKDSHRHAKAGSTSKDGTDRKRERENDEKLARQKHASDSSREKRRRSSLTSEDSSDDSRRKSHTRRRDLSPSPVRGRRRQVSRSPHSKRSQHRHSSYSTLEKTPRRRRSRSRSPPRRRHR